MKNYFVTLYKVIFFVFIVIFLDLINYLRTLKQQSMLPKNELTRVNLLNLPPVLYN